ncbi:hypothetical protein GF319_10345 [Candidatus Bathyarchaeota archaeon]|nr:hypothetical protein [Candidatus Bathyarchaeota archaeon]
MILSQVQASLSLLWGLIILVIIGSIIIAVVGALIFFIPAAIIAGVVWYITNNPNYAGIAFLVVALFSLFNR